MGINHLMKTEDEKQLMIFAESIDEYFGDNYEEKGKFQQIWKKNGGI